jgi:DNA modification methylase
LFDLIRFATWTSVALRESKNDVHPAIYSEELALRLSYEGDSILDPFLGSGTTVKVACELNREDVGYEREPQYKAVIMQKLGIAPGERHQQPVESMVA